MILTGDGTELRFEIVPPIPTAGLIDTRWELRSLIYGTGPEGVVTPTIVSAIFSKSSPFSR